MGPQAKTKPAPPPLDGEVLYDYFLKQQDGHTADHLAFLDRGIDNSPLKDQIAHYPSRLHSMRPDAGPGPTFPELGQMPDIDPHGLDFLHADISHACVAVGSWHNHQLSTRWMGRNATTPAQMWSATKPYPMVLTAIKAGSTPIDQCRLQDSSQSIPVTQAFEAIVSYRQGGSASNRLARTFKHLHTPDGLEGWVKSVTGNQKLTFRGGYGEPATMARPRLVHCSTTVLSSPGQEHKGNNLVSAYDLTRTVANLGWHSHLPTSKQLPNLEEKNADSLSRALGTDSARFFEAAWEALGLQERIEDPVVISKMGFGLSDERNQWEEVYTAFVQFTDKATQQRHQMAVALKGNQAPQDQAAQKLDSRMVAQIALIVQRQLDGKL
ncbi:hypothetical protein IV102_25445 [bacterium]|nr:hypothetical protein [bacterium]